MSKQSKMTRDLAMMRRQPGETLEAHRERVESRVRKMVQTGVTAVSGKVTDARGRTSDQSERIAFQAHMPSLTLAPPPLFPDGTIRPAPVTGGFADLLASLRLWHGCLQQGPDYLELMAWDEPIAGESKPVALQMRLAIKNVGIPADVERQIAQAMAKAIGDALAARHGGGGEA